MTVNNVNITTVTETVSTQSPYITYGQTQTLYGSYFTRCDNLTAWICDKELRTWKYKTGTDPDTKKDTRVVRRMVKSFQDAKLLIMEHTELKAIIPIPL